MSSYRLVDYTVRTMTVSVTIVKAMRPFTCKRARKRISGLYLAQLVCIFNSIVLTTQTTCKMLMQREFLFALCAD